MNLQTPWLVRYGLAVLAMVLALLLRWALIPLIGSGTLYITVYPAMMIVAVTLGAGPGVFCIALGILLTEHFLVEPAWQFKLSFSLAVRSAILLPTGFYVGWVGQRLRAAQAQAAAEVAAARTAEKALKKLNEELETRVADRTAQLIQANETVRAERKRFRDVLDMLPAYVVLLSPDYHVPFANRFFRERFGESHGKRCYEYLFNRTAPCENCETYKVLKTHAPHHWEWTGPDARNYDIHDFPFTDSDGSPLILEMGIDITERKRAQEAQSRLVSILESTSDLVSSADTHGRLLYMNKAGRRMVGIGNDEDVASLHILQFHPEWAASLVLGEGLPAAAREGVWRGENALMRRDGHEVPISQVIIAHRAPSGGVLYYSTVARDITERRKSETRTQFTNDLLQLFVKTATRKEYLDAVAELLHEWSGCRCLGIRIVDEQQRIPYESCIGFSKEFWEKENWLSLKTDQCACIRVVLGKPEPHDLPAVTPGGSFCLNNSVDFLKSLTKAQKTRFRGNCIQSGFQSIAIVPVRYRNQVLGAIHFVDERPNRVPLDKVEFIEAMTPLIGEAAHRFNIETEIRLLNESLERRVEERTAQLKAANAELESFSYSVAHDLRTPIQKIGLSLTLLQDLGDRLGDEEKECLQFIKDASDRMANLITVLLNLSKTTTGEMRRELVDLSAMAQGIALELRQAQPERGAQFVIAPDLTVDGDPRLLRITLMNLLENAWKFTARQPLAKIEFAATEKGGKKVYFVRDNGVGFDMTRADELFAPFRRLHMPGEFGGIGIGLATVRRIIHRHGGTIWAEAAPGQGATFHFTLGG